MIDVDCWRMRTKRKEEIPRLGHGNGVFLGPWGPLKMG